MFYAVVCEGMPTVYVFAENDSDASTQALEIARSTDKHLRLVFVSAHNDPAQGESQMREVVRNV